MSAFVFAIGESAMFMGVVTAVVSCMGNVSFVSHVTECAGHGVGKCVHENRLGASCVASTVLVGSDDVGDGDCSIAMKSESDSDDRIGEVSGCATESSTVVGVCEVYVTLTATKKGCLGY